MAKPKTIGKCIYVNAKLEKHFISFEIDDIEYQMDECIFYESSGEKPEIYQIQCIWKEDGILKLECKRYFRPEETSLRRMPWNGPAELYDSNCFVQCSPKKIMKKVYVEPLEIFKKRKSFNDEIFYYEKFYDAMMKDLANDPKKEDNLSMKRKLLNRHRTSKVVDDKIVNDREGSPLILTQEELEISGLKTKSKNNSDEDNSSSAVKKISNTSSDDETKKKGSNSVKKNGSSVKEKKSGKIIKEESDSEDLKKSKNKKKLERDSESKKNKETMKKSKKVSQSSSESESKEIKKKK